MDDKVPTGNIHKDLEVLSLDWRIIPSFILLMKMQKPMQNGRAKNYQRKLNGNLQREADWKEWILRGVVTIHNSQNLWLIPGKENFLTRIY